MLQIPTQPLPSQILSCVLANQNCQIAIYQKDQGLFVDLNVNSIDVTVATLALDVTPLTVNYGGFAGNLVIVDTQGNDDPDYTGLGSRFALVYLTADEFAVAEFA